MIYTREKLFVVKFFRNLCCCDNTMVRRYDRIPDIRVQGSALEISLVPEKACPGDCCYCPCGQTVKKTLDRDSFYPVDNIVQKVCSLLCRNSSIDQIVLTGVGELTLNADLSRIIYSIKNYTPAPVVLKSCGGLLWRDSVRHDCMLADTVHVNIDAADKKVFCQVNKFLLMIPFERYIDGIVRFRQLFKGNFFVNVTLLNGLNTDVAHLEKLSALIRYMEPTGVNVRTAAIAGTMSTVSVSRDSLIKFSSRFGRIASVVDAVGLSQCNQEPEHVKM